jgi:hypothetical protein
MTQPEEPVGDPLIDEVRSRRRALLASCGNDLNRLLERIEQLQRQHPGKMVDRRSAAAPLERDRRE